MNENQELADYLKPTEFIDSDNPDIVSKAEELTDGCADEKEKLGNIYYFVRDFPYDILDSFRYLAEGKRQASDVLNNGKAFCMGKASMFAALCRASGIPSRIGFQQLHCPDKPFMNEEVAKIWGRPQAAVALAGRSVSGRQVAQARRHDRQGVRRAKRVCIFPGIRRGARHSLR